jgi:hypothetical protein
MDEKHAYEVIGIRPDGSSFTVEIVQRVVSLLCLEWLGKTDLAWLVDIASGHRRLEFALNIVICDAGNADMRDVANLGYMALKWDTYQVELDEFLAEAEQLAPPLRPQISAIMTELNHR